MIIDNLISKILQVKNPSVVGIDTTEQILPQFLKDKYLQEYGDVNIAIPKAMGEFNKQILDAISDVAGIVKVQIAFYEAYGIEGMKVYRDTVKYAKSQGLMVIGDIKRGDIGSTCEGYAQGHFTGDFEVDFVTLNPYLGYDSIEAFTKDENKGSFILVKTSNKSSGDFQDLEVEGKKIYEVVAQKVEQWGSNSIGNYGYSNVGAVVGATYPREAADIRNIMKNSIFLVPGYGAQGGGAKDVLPCFDDKGLGAIVNSSRGILGAYRNTGNHEQYAMAARKAAATMAEDIKRALLDDGRKVCY